MQTLVRPCARCASGGPDSCHLPQVGLWRLVTQLEGVGWDRGGVTYECKPWSGHVPDVPVVDRAAAIFRRSLPDQFPFECKVQGVTFSVENHVLMRLWHLVTGSIQAPVTRSLVILMGPEMNDFAATSYWIDTDLSQIWAFKSVISHRGELNVLVAKLPIQTSAPNADGLLVLERRSEAGQWRREVATRSSIDGYLPVEAISVDFGEWNGYVAVTLQNHGGDRKSLMHCDKLPDWISCPASMW